MLRRWLYPILCAPATEAGALEAMNTALADPQVAPPPAAGEEHADAGGEGGEADGGAGSEERGAARADSEAGAGTEGEPTGDDGAPGGEASEEGAHDDAAAQAPKPGEAGSRHRADGTFKSKDELAKDAAAISAAETRAQPTKPKPGAQPEIDPKTGKPKEPAAAKKVDHVNDPIPAEVKGRTRERMEGLVAVAKDLNTKLEAQNAELESGRELFGMIEATGANAETFARHMEVLALMGSSDVGEQQQAVKLLRAAADKLGQQLGEPAPGKDVLEGHQDLIDEVEAGETTRARAEEIARFRNEKAALERRRTEDGQRNSEQTAVEQKRAEVKTALNTLSGELRKKDGDEVYKRKHAILVPFIKRLNAALPVDKIVASVREAYDALVLPTAPAAANGKRAPAGTGGQQPARALQGAGAGGARQPKSGLEALELGLEEHARSQGRVA